MKDSTKIANTEISVLLGGGAGQGLKTVENLLTRIAKLSGYHIFATKEYMSRVRGGCNSTQIRIASKRAAAVVARVDIFIPLSTEAVERYAHRISDSTLLVGDSSLVSDDNTELPSEIIDIPFLKIAREMGNVVYANVIAVGLICGVINVEKKVLTDYLSDTFARKGEEVVKNNLEAASTGYERGRELTASGKISVEIERDDSVRDEIIINGAEAVAMGAIAGGCNFISAYPMSPSTGVLTFLSKHAKDFHIVADQAEDEIAAINAVIGAWFAGGRGLASTSGGGFALMEEGLSLAGISESPAVIHLAQRPGPATGLPTRMEQGDLDLTLYAGHGEFPRIILAPGNTEEAFTLTQKAFNLADRYQAPVFILTDQYLIDSVYNIPLPDVDGLKVEKHIVKTDPGYKRYRFSKEGISPRGIPNYGSGLVGLDSHEHNEEGHISEDLELRGRMVEKRLLKMQTIRKDIIPPRLIGKEDCRLLLIGWGSTLNIVAEALQRLNNDDLSFLHFSQVFPLHPDTKRYLEKAEITAVIENNATGQFSRLIHRETEILVDRKILKYTGLAFTVEEVIEKVEEIMGEKI